VTGNRGQAAFTGCLAFLSVFAAGTSAMESPAEWRALSERTRARMQEMDETIRDRDQERSYRNYLAMFADHVVAHGVLASGDTDIDGLRAHYRPVFFELKGGVLLSDEVIVAGNMAAQRYHSLLYLSGEFDGVEGRSQPVFLRGQTFFHFDPDNRIAERWSNHDHGYRLGQLKGPEGRVEGDRIARHLNGPGLSESEVFAKLDEMTRAFNRMESPQAREQEYLALFAKTVVVHGIGEQSVGPQELRQQLSQLWAAIPDLQLAVETRLSAWSMGALRWRALGSHRAAYRGREPDMRPVSLRGETIMRFDGVGHIVEIWINAEPLEFDHGN
jgi:hypothetical protein